MSAAFMRQPLYTGCVTIWNRRQKTRNYLAIVEWAGGVERIWQAAINSWNGLVAVTRSEAAFRQEIMLLAAGVPLAYFLTEEPSKRFALIGVLVFILIVELLNTAIEKLSDRITRDNDPAIKRVKDMGSAAVGLSLLAAGAVWLWILFERLGL
jgi:diacylglycerol kinase (ATP)